MKPHNSAPWNPINACATSSNDLARCARRLGGRTTHISASTSRRNSYGRPPSRSISRRAVTTWALFHRRADAGAVEPDPSGIENLNAKYDYQTQYSALQFTLGNLR